VGEESNNKKFYVSVCIIATRRVNADIGAGEEKLETCVLSFDMYKHAKFSSKIANVLFANPRDGIFQIFQKII
jgi:hypothetical protein